jgi:hypothetical protein
MFLRRCRWRPMVQGSSCGFERFQTSSQDHGWGSLLSIFYPSGNQQDVPRLEEEFLVDKNEARDNEVCVWMWHVSKSQDRSFETSRKSTTHEHSWVEMEKHLYGLHCGFTAHIVWVTPFGSLWIAWLSQPIIYPYPPHIGLGSMQSYTCHTSSVIMDIVSDRGSIFVAHFWEQLHECLGTHLIRSSTYHP